MKYKNDKNKPAVVVMFVDNKSKISFMKEKKKLNYLNGFKKVLVNDILSKESFRCF